MKKNNYNYKILFILLLFTSTYASTHVLITDAHSTLVVPPVKLLVTKHERPSITSGPVDIISREEIASAGVTSVAQALQSLGGIQTQNLSGNDADVLFSLRGFGANAASNTVLLINGIPITNPDMQPPDLNSLPLTEVQSIEIISGSESVLYGDQAVGGAINIITHSQANDGMVFSCTGGSYLLKQCSFGYHHKFAQTDLAITAGNRHTDNYREHNRDDETTLSGRANYFYQRGWWHTEFIGANEQMQYPGALTAAQVAANRRQANNDTDFFNNINVFLQIQNHHDLNDDWSVQTDLARRQMDGHGVLSSPFTQFRWSNFVKPQVMGTVGGARVIAGADYQNDHYGLTTSFGPDNDRLDKYSVFAIANFPLQTQWSTSIGFRAARQLSQLNGLPVAQNNGFASTIGATYHYTERVQFYLRRAESFRFPKADENAFAFPVTNGLRTQRGVAYEGGMETTGDSYSGKVGVYQLNLKDEIAYDPTQTPQFPFGANTNFPPTLRRGFTLSGHYHAATHLVIDGQYNHVLAQFDQGVNQGKRIPLVSQDILRTGIHYHFARHWSLYPEALFTGNQFAANDDANVAGKIGGYTTYNINLRFQYQRFSASLRFNNIFNKYYYLYTAYVPMMQADIFYPAPGRNVALIMNYAL